MSDFGFEQRLRDMVPGERLTIRADDLADHLRTREDVATFASKFAVKFCCCVSYDFNKNDVVFSKLEPESPHIGKYGVH